MERLVPAWGRMCGCCIDLSPVFSHFFHCEAKDVEEVKWYICGALLLGNSCVWIVWCHTHSVCHSVKSPSYNCSSIGGQFLFFIFYCVRSPPLGSIFPLTSPGHGLFIPCMGIPCRGPPGYPCWGILWPWAPNGTMPGVRAWLMPIGGPLILGLFMGEPMLAGFIPPGGPRGPDWVMNWLL